MEPRFPHEGAAERAPETGSAAPPESSRPAELVCLHERACCCPAPPVVRAIMPPTPARPHHVDLLLCGHHYRVSRRTLAAAGARILNLPGRADAAAAALFDAVQRDRAGV
jgi:hypothetical protein